MTLFAPRGGAGSVAADVRVDDDACDHARGCVNAPVPDCAPGG